MWYTFGMTVDRTILPMTVSFIEKRIGVIVPTRNRPSQLRGLLQSLRDQTRTPDRVLVVDTSDRIEPVRDVIGDFGGADLEVGLVRHDTASAADQRNRGLDELEGGGYDLIGFLDDDTCLARDAIEKVLACFASHGEEVAGVGLNMTNPLEGASFLQRSVLSALELYPANGGGVARSGWQQSAVQVEEDIEVNWLPTGAVFWRGTVLRTRRFDRYFVGYSYLEDLDFSYPIGKCARLIVCADAQYRHFNAETGRPEGYDFGRIEVRNRLYFVRKHGFSFSRCWAMLLLRAATNALLGVTRMERGYWNRLLGNLKAMMQFGLASRASPEASCPRHEEIGPAAGATGGTTAPPGRESDRCGG